MLEGLPRITVQDKGTEQIQTMRSVGWVGLGCQHNTWQRLPTQETAAVGWSYIKDGLWLKVAQHAQCISKELVGCLQLNKTKYSRLNLNEATSSNAV